MTTPAGKLDGPHARDRQPAHLPPHTPFAEHGADAAHKHTWLREIFDETAMDYDRAERWLALGTGSWYRRQALVRAGLKPGMRIVDIACGTGLVAREAQRIVGQTGSVLGVDPSPGMLKHAIANTGIHAVDGRAEAIPAGNASFDLLSMGYALRHVDDLEAAFAEFRRVLKPDGRICLLEITTPESTLGRRALKTYMRLALGVFCRFGRRSARTAELWRYYWETMDRCVRPVVVLQALEAAGFADVRRGVQLGVFSEYTGRAV